MTHNPITQEAREIRYQLAAQQGNYIHRIGDELRRRQMVSGRRIVRLPKREPEVPSLNTRMHGIGECQSRNNAFGGMIDFNSSGAEMMKRKNMWLFLVATVLAPVVWFAGVVMELAGLGAGVAYASGGFAKAPPDRTAVIAADDPKPTEKKPMYFTLTNPSKDIVVVSDRDEKFVEFFRRQRVLVAGLGEKEFEATMKAEKTSEKEQGVIYASYNEEDRTALYGAMVKLAPVAKPVAEAIAALIPKDNVGRTLVMVPDPKEKDVWHIVGLTTRTPVGFFMTKDKEGTDDFAANELLFKEKK